jgi:hypothetical protein
MCAGDSLSEDNFLAPTVVMNALQRWLQARFKGKFKDCGDSLEHGIQEDGFSCLVCSANTIGHAVFDDELWHMNRAAVVKVDWFQILIKCGVDSPSLMPNNDREPPIPAPVTGVPMPKQCMPSLANLLNPKEVTSESPLAIIADDTSVSMCSHEYMEAPNITTPNSCMPSLANILNPVVLPKPMSVEVQDKIVANSEGSDTDRVGLLMDIDVDSTIDISLSGHLSQNKSSVTMDYSGSTSIAQHSGSLAVTSNTCLTNVADAKLSAKSNFFSLFKRASDNAPSYKKRSRSSDVSSSNSALSDTAGATRCSTVKRPRYDSIVGPIGISKSSVHAKKTRDAAKRGQLTIKEEQEKKWRESLTKIDPNVEFINANVSAARHYNCGKTIKVKQPYDTTRFSKHVSGCKGIKKKSNTSGGAPTLFQMASVGKWAAKVVPQAVLENPTKKVPCHGVSGADHTLIPEYLGRTMAKGGGSRSIAKIALGMFQKTFSLLGGKEKKAVDDIQCHEHQWRNDHAKLRVFSTRCKRSMMVRSDSADSGSCTECQALLQNNKFTIALRKPTPHKKNYKFVNRRFQDPVLGELYARTKGLQDLIESAVLAVEGHCWRMAITSPSGE